jgi:FAD:protein FMN transferase
MPINKYSTMKNLLFLSFAFFVLFASCKQKDKAAQYIANEGFIYNTVYHVTYESPKGIDLHEKISAELKRFDFSLSTFNKESVLSKINRNESVETDEYFRTVFSKSIEIAEKTNGAFDPTVAPLVNAWGFGFKAKENVTAQLIDSLLQFVGYNKIRLTADNKIEKDDPRIMLDFSAIAKGYSVDVISNLLTAEGCKNYMVEIGGEVVTKGVNREGKPWRIGINEPNDNEPIVPQNLQAIIGISNLGLATSGNYRNFYIEEGKKYAHTINPETGYPVNHNLLSATVIAPNCMTADAYATACMVLGVEKAKQLASTINEIDIFLIYSTEDTENEVLYSSGFEKYIIE